MNFYIVLYSIWNIGIFVGAACLMVRRGQSRWRLFNLCLLLLGTLFNLAGLIWTKRYNSVWPGEHVVMFGLLLLLGDLITTRKKSVATQIR